MHKTKDSIRSLIYTSINSAELCIWSFKQNERLWAGPSPDAVAGRKALAHGVKSSRMEESVGNNKRIEPGLKLILDGLVKRILVEEAKYGCIE